MPTSRSSFGGNANTDALPNAHQGGVTRPLRAGGVQTMPWSSTTDWLARCSTSSTSWGSQRNTIVVYSTDNGPHFKHVAGCCDHAVAQREELELGGRPTACPVFVRWPEKFEAGKTLTGIMSHQEWLPTLVSAAGEPGIVEKTEGRARRRRKAFSRYTSTDTTLFSYLLGETDESPRDWFLLHERRRADHRDSLR